MRISIVLLFMFCLHISARSVSQTITFSGKNVSLEKIFQSVEKQTGYVFLHDGGVFKETTPVSIEVSKTDLQSFLQLVLKDQPLEYTIESKTIIIRKKNPFPIPALPVPIKITGQITDEQGNPLPGVSVHVNGTKTGTVTNASGMYIITDVEEDAILTFTFIGFTKQEVPVKGRSLISLKLAAAVNKLDEAVVQAYGTTSQRYSTGNITKIKGTDIMKNPVSNVLATIDGMAPGVVVTPSSGMPGAGFKVEIRGRAAFDRLLSDDQPLFIVDGVPMAANNNRLNKLASAVSPNLGLPQNYGISPFNSINMNDIESMEILKDADATAIYGSRGANGVVIITTKKGKEGNTRANFNVYTGISKVTRTMDMLNTKQYLQMRREAFANSNTVMTNNNAYDALLWDTTRNTDFTKLLIGGTAKTTDAQVSVSGGNVNTQYLISGGYHRETTVYPGDMHEQRGSLHFNINTRSVNKKFNMNFSGSYAANENNMIAADLASAITLPPNFQVYDSTGKLAWNEKGILSRDNPLASLLNQPYKASTSNLQLNTILGYKILPNLEIRSSIGLNSTQTDETRKITRASQNPAKSTTGSSQFGNNQFKSWIIEPQVEYYTKLAKGRLTVLGGATFNAQSNAGTYISANGYTSDELLGTLAGAGLNGITIQNTSSQYRYQAFFGRINYNLNNTYLLNISGRRDGSSRFGPDFRFSNFGAVGAGWLFSNARFIPLPKVLSYGKIRASYGVTGNDKIGDYKYLDSWKATINTYSDSATLYPTLLYNPLLHWEKNNKLEVAMDLGFIEDRVLFTVAAYRNASSDPLVSYPLPVITGFSSITANLNGVEILNTGLEFTLTTVNIRRKDFQWNTNFNLTIPKNKLNKYPDLANSSYATTYQIGESLNSFYNGNLVGVDPQTGLYTVVDVNKDNLFNAKDFQINGNKDRKFYGGLQNSFSYKGLQLDFLLQFVKQTGVNYRGNNFGALTPTLPGTMYNQPADVMRRWQRPGDKTDIQKFMLSNGTTSGTTGYYAMYFTDYIYSDASFMRLKNISLSYSLPTRWIKGGKIAACRIYAQAQNLFTLTHYKGADPETQNYLAMPLLRTITGGLQINL